VKRAVIAARLANMTRGGDTGKNQYSEWQSANLQNGKINQSTAAELLNVSPRLVATVKAVEREARGDCGEAGEYELGRG